MNNLWKTIKRWALRLILRSPVYQAERTGDDVPEMTLWYVAIAPIEPPEESKGGIALIDSVRDRAQATATVGFITAMGPLAFCSKTRGGLDMTVQRDTIGLMDCVLFPAFAGQRMTLKDGTKFVFIKDIEIMGKVNDHERYAAFI